MHIKENARLVEDLTLRNVKGKYSGTILGFSLAVIVPLVLAAAVNLIFKIIYEVQIPNFAFFVLAGMLPWMFFSNSLSEAINSLSSNMQIIKQVAVPRCFYPLSSVLGNFCNFLLGFIFLFPFFLCCASVKFLHIPALIFVFIGLLFFTIGVSFLLVIVKIYVRDVDHLFPVVLMIWFWLSPVFYDLEMVKFPYRWLCLLNPLTYYVVPARQILYEGRLPELYLSTGSLVFALLSFFAGYLFFKKHQHQILKIA